MARAAQKYEPHERLKATSTCLKRGWDVGTWLASKEWKLPRQIERFPQLGAFVVLRGKNGQFFRAMSLPTDVHSVLDPRPSKKTTVFLVCRYRADYSRRDDPDSYRMDKILHAALNRPSAKRLQACEHVNLNGIAAENNEIRIVEIEAEQ